MGIEVDVEEEINKRYRKYNPQYINVTHDPKTNSGTAVFWFGGVDRKSASYEVRNNGRIYVNCGPEDDFYGGLDLYVRPPDDPLLGALPCCDFGMKKFNCGGTHEFKAINARTASSGGWIDFECICRNKWRYDQRSSPAQWVQLKE